MIFIRMESFLAISVDKSFSNKVPSFISRILKVFQLKRYRLTKYKMNE